MKRDQQVAEIRAALAVLAEPGQVVELRAPGIRTGRASALIPVTLTTSTRWGNRSGAPRQHARRTWRVCDLNPIVPDLLARAANRVEPWAQETTADTDVTRRRWL